MFCVLMNNNSLLEIQLLLIQLINNFDDVDTFDSLYFINPKTPNPITNMTDSIINNIPHHFKPELDFVVSSF